MNRLNDMEDRFLDPDIPVFSDYAMSSFAPVGRSGGGTAWDEDDYDEE